MVNLIEPYINSYIDNIIKSSNKKTLFVFKGFLLKYLHAIKISKLLDKSLNISIQDLYNSKPELLVQAIIKQNETKVLYYWCTYEEYLLLEDILPMYYDIKILYNNIFYKTFPCIYNIDDLDYILEYFDNEAINYEDNEQKESLSIFLFFYGNIIQGERNLYITYVKDSNKLENDLIESRDYDIEANECEMYHSDLIDLTENEVMLLDLTSALLSGTYNRHNIQFAYSSDIGFGINNYRERIAILNSLFGNEKKFYIYEKCTSKSENYDENRYLEILKEYWGYKSFRNLKMYRNVNDPINYREIIEISQSQIINDIVVQAENAMIGDPFRDIFVTSPTGAGKSLMFQIPAILLAKYHEAMTIVISPLIGLMVDQVEGLHNKKISIAATINSEITPIEKIEIKERIRKKEVSLLYISPETLLSRSDIVDLIGERKVGLFVVDEAHIVTTWGKSFRADYWYLGNYLQKLRKKINFPIATFTATAIYGGPEDMYKETRDSLNLINPISYFGYVKRDDIVVKLGCSKNHDKEEKSKEYRDKKFKITTYRLEAFVRKNQKTLVYFPTVTLIYDFISYVNLYGTDELKTNIVIYHGKLDKLIKNEGYLRFKNNECLIMLATKAFGMGIDIPDIMNVYHFAPTGNVCDYVQEIGRAARAIDQGFAQLDYLSRDFTHVNRLHGISTLRENQLIQVMRKILSLYIKNGEKRNLLISAEEFKHVFANGKSEDIDIDNKVKTALLIIEKDFLLRFQYSPLVARPRSLFTTDYFVVPKENELAVKNAIGNYISLWEDKNNNFNDTGDIYLCDMKSLWEAKYRNLSFAQFKYHFYSKPEELGLEIISKVIPVMRIELELKVDNLTALKSGFESIISVIENKFGQYTKSGKYFELKDLSLYLQSMINQNKYFCENLIDVIISSMQYYQSLQKEKSNFYMSFLKYNESTNKYSLQNSGYNDFFVWLRNKVEYIVKIAKPSQEKKRFNFYISKPRSDKTFLEQMYISLGIIETMDLVVYETKGGDNPQIYVRINSKLQLDRVTNNPSKYENQILKNVKDRHYMSVKMLKYLFENEVDSNMFWDIIEDYFLGHVPEQVMSN